MTILPWLLATACAMILSTPLQSQTDNSAEVEKKSTVTKLDGTKLSGFVEVTDDYTLRITNDSGITRVPIAQLGDSSFARYGFRKDRTKDGRFWYERKEALKFSVEEPKSKADSKSGEKSAVETRLEAISAFQPVIATYEKTLSFKNSEKTSAKSKSAATGDGSDVPFRPMFSEPGLGGPLPQPFRYEESSAIQSVTGAFERR
jgi:hypothetical protein